MGTEREERIRLRAFEIWRSAGCPEARDHEHWAQAENELKAQHGEVPTSAEIASDDEEQSRERLAGV
jgi:hypothetical protein